jgi:hypothetical protein
VSNSQPIDEKKISVLRREAERIEEDATYSSKSHFNAEGRWEQRQYWLGVPATTLSAIAGATLIRSQPELASVCALAAALLTGLMTFLKPNERAALHRAAAAQFLALRNDARFFREIDLLCADRFDQLPEKLKTLSARRNELNQKSPRIPRAAFEAARKGIEEGEASHRVDKRN